MKRHKVVLVAGVTAWLALACLHASAQDLNPAIHYKTQSPADARFELLQSALVARLTLLVDKNSGDVFQIVTTPNNNLAWEKIYRIKSNNDHLDETQVNFEVFVSGIAARYTYLLNVHTGQTWVLSEDKKQGLFWSPIWDPAHLAIQLNRSQGNGFDSTLPGRKEDRQ
jgi:hypothetical protein